MNGTESRSASSFENAAADELEDLQIVQPYGYGAAVKLRPKEPHAFLRYIVDRYLHGSGHYASLWEGSLVEIVDDEEQPIWFTAYSHRLSSGSGGTRPDFRCCDPHPIRTLSPASRRRAPCSASRSARERRRPGR